MKRIFRMGATGIAMAALALLGWRMFQPSPEIASSVHDVTLWTAGAAPEAVGEGRHVALADASNAPPGAQRIPDAAFLRRAFPMLRRITIKGDGIDEPDTAALRGLEVEWQRPAVTRPASPMLAAFSAPRRLSVGQRMIVHGRLRGLRPREPVIMSLEGPDGSKQSHSVQAADDGDATFSLSNATAAVAPGAFEWTVRLGSGQSWAVGAVVGSAELPRVLLLQAAPTVEGGRLQRWLAESGAPVTSRTRVSAAHVRFATSGGSPADFPRLDAAILARFDVVVAGEAALNELAAEETAALEGAIRQDGVGLMVIGESGLMPRASFGTWRFRARDDRETSEEKRMARLRLWDGAELAEPITVAATEIIASPDARWLVRDPQERLLGAAVRSGRGWLARSLVLDTWRWLQGGHPEIFARYWSSLLSLVARPATITEGRWSLANAPGPIVVDELVRLVWVGAPSAPLPEADVRTAADSNTNPVRLQLARDGRDAARAEALHWPARAGWHEVRALPSGPSLAFYVQPARAFDELKAEQRRDATARLAQRSLSSSEISHKRTSVDVPRTRMLANALWFALFLASASWLWWEQRKR